MARLAERRRLIVPDVPGLGESEPFERMDPESFSEWFEQFLEVTCHEKPELVAHSLIGSLAARFAVQRGDLLRGLVLYGTPGVGHYRIPLGLMITAIRFSLHPSEQNSARFSDWAFLDPGRTRRQDPAWYDAFKAYGLAKGRVPHIKRTMRQLVKAGSKQVSETDLRGVPVPVALVWGRQDRMAPLRLAELASSRFGWPLQVVDHAGHVPHIEQPVEFVRAVRAAFPDP